MRYDGTDSCATVVPIRRYCHIRFLNDLSLEEKKQITVRMFILFPELFSNQGKTKYKRAALWLCSRQALICSNIRDFFTAGGQVTEIGTYHFDHAVPQILKRLYDSKDEVIALLSHPDKALADDINELWTLECNLIYYKTCWLNMMQNVFNTNSELKDIKIEDLLEK